jgi:hypothetical protein
MLTAGGATSRVPKAAPARDPSVAESTEIRGDLADGIGGTICSPNEAEDDEPFETPGADPTRDPAESAPAPTASEAGELSGISPTLTRTLSDVTGCATYGCSRDSNAGGTACDWPAEATICGDSGAAWKPEAVGENDALFTSPRLTLALPSVGVPRAGAPDEPFVDPVTPASGVALGIRVSEVVRPPALSGVGNDGDAEDGEVDIAPLDVPDPTISEAGEVSGISPTLTRTFADVTGCAA